MSGSEEKPVLKAVKELYELLDDAFVEGKCQCVRCQESQGDQSKYAFKHSFNVEGQYYRRKFARSARNELSEKLKKAWQSHFKELPSFVEDTFISLDNFKAFIDDEHFVWFLLLGQANQLFAYKVDHIKILPPPQI